MGHPLAPAALLALGACLFLAPAPSAEAGWCGKSGGVPADGVPTGAGGDPLLVVSWIPQLLSIRTVTGEGPAAKPADLPAAPAKDGKEGKKEERPVLRGLDLPTGNEKPVLVYFHWPHEDGAKGKAIQRFCRGPMDDMEFVKVSPLFRCVEINTRDSAAPLVAEAKVKATPSLLVCAPDGTVVWRTEDTGLSGKGLAAVLKKVIQDEFPLRWAAIEKERQAQKDALREADSLLSKGKAEESDDALRRVVDSEVRFTEEWAIARRLLADAEKKSKEKPGK